MFSSVSSDESYKSERDIVVLRTIAPHNTIPFSVSDLSSQPYGFPFVFPFFENIIRFQLQGNKLTCLEISNKLVI